jgi:hypothetical protein
VQPNVQGGNHCDVLFAADGLLLLTLRLHSSYSVCRFNFLPSLPISDVQDFLVQNCFFSSKEQMLDP